VSPARPKQAGNFGPPCRDFVTALVDYLDGSLPLLRRSEFDLHLERCARCRILHDTTRRTIELYKREKCCVPLEVESRLMTALAIRTGSRLTAGGTER